MTAASSKAAAEQWPGGHYDGQAPPEADSFEAEVSRLVEQLESLSKQPDAKLTCEELLATIGTKSHALALLIFSLLNLLPAPPGYNFMLGLLITGLAILMTFDRPMQLWGLVGNRRLPLKLLIKLLGILGWLSERVGRVSAPRLQILTSRWAVPLLGVFCVLMGLIMLLPIPFTNMLPSISVALICLALLNRDGVVLVLGLVAGVAGAVFALVATWFIVALVYTVEEEIYEALEEQSRTP